MLCFKATHNAATAIAMVVYLNRGPGQDGRAPRKPLNGSRNDQSIHVRRCGAFKRVFGDSRPEFALSKQIIEAHQGQIWPHPRKGGGAEFSFTLPMPTGGNL